MNERKKQAEQRQVNRSPSVHNGEKLLVSEANPYESLCHRRCSKLATFSSSFVVVVLLPSFEAVFWPTVFSYSLCCHYHQRKDEEW